jgi:flagellar biosynthesis chaperone FliJ
MELQERAKGLSCEDSGAVQSFVDLVTRETEEVLAALSGLEEEIKELQNQDAEVKEEEQILLDLDEKFEKHFRQLKENHDGVSADTT